MAKKPKFQRSDIPLKDRLLMNKFATIAEHRDHAARVAMMIATVALNDTLGLGYERIARFAHRQQELRKNIMRILNIRRKSSISGCGRWDSGWRTEGSTVPWIRTGTRFQRSCWRNDHGT